MFRTNTILAFLLASSLVASPGFAERYNKHYSAGSGTTPILDQVSGNLVGAYSLRLLTGSYTGSAVKLRRASDSTTKDIPFTAAGKLDITTASTFCVATSCFIDTWYDQSGNTNNATQPTTAKQPIFNFADTGLNNQPSVGHGADSALWLQIATSASADCIYCSGGAGGYTSQVFNMTTVAGASNDRLNSTAVFDIFVNAGSTQIRTIQQTSVTSGRWDITTPIGTGANSIQVAYDASSLVNNAIVYKNNISQSLTTTPPVGVISTDAGATKYIGGTGAGIAFPGNTAEFIYYKVTLPSLAQQAALYADQKAYYNLP